MISTKTAKNMKCDELKLIELKGWQLPLNMTNDEHYYMIVIIFKSVLLICVCDFRGCRYFYLYGN